MKLLLAFAVVLVAGIMMETRAAEPCICTANYDPVCATNGLTYGNDCGMRCDGAELHHVGVCVSRADEFACTTCQADWQPVCGTNGITYSNDCAMRCDGATLANIGMCGEE